MKIELLRNLKASKILLMIVIDAMVCGLLVTIFYLDSIAGVLAIVFIFLFSVLMYAVMFELKRIISFYFFMNIIFAPAILFLSILLSVFLTGPRFQSKTFFIGRNKYELNINNVPKTYGIFEMTENGIYHLKEMSHGDIIKRKDSTFLLSPKCEIKIYKNILFGFPKVKDTVILKDE